MPKILICPLGHAPGVVTGTLDALQDIGVTVDKVVLLWLQHPDDEKMKEFPSTVRILREEFDIHYKNSMQLDLDSGKLILTDVKDESSNKLFYNQMIHIIGQLRGQQGTQLLVSVSGGRKTMAALTFLAAAVKGIGIVENLYHLIVDDDIEEIGQPDSWTGDADRRQNALHPPKEKRMLVELPSPQEIIHSYQNPGAPAPSPRRARLGQE
jgi:CRISPR-associated protein (TIGR02584 family)